MWSSIVDHIFLQTIFHGIDTTKVGYRPTGYSPVKIYRKLHKNHFQVAKNVAHSHVNSCTLKAWIYGETTQYQALQAFLIM